jgi:hypothetical protein
MQYTSYTENEMPNINNINYYLKKPSFSERIETEDFFFAFENIEGEYVSFGLYEEEFIYNTENKETINLIMKKYDIQDKLLSYYKDMIFHGVVKNEVLYIFYVIYLTKNFSPGLYETFNLTSLLGLNFVPVIIEKTTQETEEKNIVLTQRNGVDFGDKVFIKQ